MSAFLPASRSRRYKTLLAVTVLQAVSGAWFLYDLLAEFSDLWLNPLHQVPEATAVVALWIGTIIGIRQIRDLVGDNRRMEDRLRTASGAFLDLLEESFSGWGLTPSERDVALLAIKGLSISEIAQLRNTRDGTVKAQCAAVYRKAGVGSRAQLLSHFIDDLMAGVVLDRPDR